MKLSRFYLFFSAAGLLPIAMSYRLDPNRILPKLFQFHPVESDTVHALRAIMVSTLRQSYFGCLAPFGVVP